MDILYQQSQQIPAEHIAEIHITRILKKEYEVEVDRCGCVATQAPSFSASKF